MKRELKTDYHYLPVITMINENARAVHEQVKIFRTLSAAPIVVVTGEPVNKALKIKMLNDGVDRFINAMQCVNCYIVICGN